MLIKFYEESPDFKEAIKILKSRYKTTASSRAVRRCVLEFSKSGHDNEHLIEIIKLKDREISHLKKVIEKLLGY